MLLISDESLRELYLDASLRTPSLRSVSDHGVVLNSLSRNFGAPGLRVGWAVGDPSWLVPARLVHGYAGGPASRPAQRAARALLSHAEPITREARALLGQRFAVLRAALRQELGVNVSIPDGGYHLWLALPERDEVRNEPFQFCVRLRDEARVVIIPGASFGGNGADFVRLSFCTDPDTIEEGVRRMGQLWCERSVVVGAGIG